MKKLLKLYSLALALGLSYSVANAQNTTEGAARMPETEGTTIVVETEKKVIAPKENSVVVTENKAKVAKSVDVNTETVEFKDLKTTKKIVKGDRIKKHLKPQKEDKTNISKNVKLGLILILIGLVLSAIFWGGLYWLGGIFVLVGLIIIILDLLDEL